MHLILRGYLPDLSNFVIGKYLFVVLQSVMKLVAEEQLNGGENSEHMLL